MNQSQTPTSNSNSRVRVAVALLLLVAAVVLIVVSCGGDDPVTTNPATEGAPDTGSDSDSTPGPDATTSQLQSDLASLGYYDGPINGEYDSATEEAVREFQEFAGIVVDGKYGPQTANALDVAVGRSGGGEGLQTALAALCYYRGPIDGDYGPATTEALEAFQSDAGIAVDGQYGPETAEALVEAWPSRPAECPLEESPEETSPEETPEAGASFTASIDGSELVFDQEVSCELGADDSGSVQGVAEDGTSLSAVLDGSASRVVIEGPVGSFDAEFTYLSNDQTTLIIDASPPEIHIEVPLAACSSAE